MSEKTLTEIPRSLREQYEKGIAALHKQNLDYAISLFDQVLQKEPAFYECREALRAAQFKKAGAIGGLFRRVLGAATSSPVMGKAQLALRSHPLEALRLAEQILNSDPYSFAAHKILAEAALAAGLPRTAVLSLEIVHKQFPKDKELTLKLAAALLEAGQNGKAEALLIELAKIHPLAPDIASALKNASASKSLHSASEKLAEGEGSYRDILQNEGESLSLEQEHREVKTEEVAARLIAENEARLRQEPDNLKLYRNIAELYVQQKEFDLALQYYQKLLQRSGSSEPSVEKAIAETTVKKFDAALARLDPHAPDFRERTEQLTAEKEAFVLADCEQRSARYPADLQIRFELGQLYFQTGKLREAIQEFQKSQANPHLRIPSLLGLGKSFAARGMNDLAVRTFQTAIREKLVFDDEKKELIYCFGCVLEKLAKPEEAVEQFKQIYQVDIGFKDVADKVDAYYGTKLL